ncbi:putative uncharacterized protein C7orf78 homolog isoform X2 [Dendropsophus ebraccatus]
MSISIRHPGDNDSRYFFTRQVKFTAINNLAVERSDNHLTPEAAPLQNIWKKKPPDFSLRLYKSLNLPRRLEETDRKKVREIPKRPELEGIRVTPPPPRLRRSGDPQRFLTRFRPVDPLESSTLYVRNGVYPKEKYKDPHPHDFRQYETDIPDFVTSYSRDPFNLKFKAQGLSSSCELPPIEAKRSRVKVKRFILPKPPDPQWDSQLILPRSPWPPKSASYTRHRRRRGVYTAFMDRVEEKFTASNQDSEERVKSRLKQ